MCHQIIEGIQYRGCGHFVKQWLSAIYDCKSTTCEKSSTHPSQCYSKACLKAFGQDTHKVSALNYEACPRCKQAAGHPQPHGYQY